MDINLFKILHGIILFLYIAVSLIFFTVIGIRRWREKNSPDLIAIGIYQDKIGKYIGWLIVLSIFCQIVSKIDFSLQTLFNFIYLGLLILPLHFSSPTKVYVFKDGISFFQFKRSTWDRYGSYLWDNRDENKLILFKKGGGKNTFTIPAEKRREVNLLLEMHLKPA